MYGGRSENPLALENLVDDDLLLSKDAMIKRKPKGYDEKNGEDGSEVFDEPLFGVCPLSDMGIRQNATPTSSPMGR